MSLPWFKFNLNSGSDGLACSDGLATAASLPVRGYSQAVPCQWPKYCGHGTRTGFSDYYLGLIIK